VLDGRTVVGTTTIAISFFSASTLTAIALSCAPGGERAAGRRLGAEAAAVPDAAGMLLFATPLSIDAADLLQGIAEVAGELPVFGGGAGDYAASGHSLISFGTQVLHRGAAAVVLSGPQLNIEARTYLGWQPLSRPMTVTDVDGMVVRKIDDAPAFDIYRRYLGLTGDENFFLNALEFPFLTEREGQVLARVPVAIEQGGALRFVADIARGETVRLGYGNPSLIVADARGLRDVMDDFGPEAVFLYTCGCRRFLMQDDTDLETSPFQDVAPTSGFYTYGEFYGRGRNLHLLNSAMVAVGLREGDRPARRPRPIDTTATPASGIRDPYANQHARVVSRLVHFIGAVTEELNASNAELHLQSTTDRLTRIYNRHRLEQMLAETVSSVAATGEELAVVLIDIDHFKQVNDTHGHATGDAVIVHLVDVIRDALPPAAVFGRWGGEEFLLILPQTGAAAAGRVAEVLRDRIAVSAFPTVGHQTASFGVASHRAGETLENLLARADQALYQAKHAGRDRVAVS
jgi:diguanylate cyclase (GGDEF)-like protein